MTIPTGQQFTEGMLDNQPVATFSVDGPYQSANDYTATIDWDDGTTTPGKVEQESPGQFEVLADNMHVYKDTGSYNLTVTVYNIDGDSSDGSGSAAVVDPQLVGWGQIYGSDGSGNFPGGVMATFLDPGGSTNVNDFSATVTISDDGNQSKPVPCTMSAGDGTNGTVKGEFYVSIGQCSIYTTTDNVVGVCVYEEGGTAQSYFWSDIRQYQVYGGLASPDGGYVTATEGQPLDSNVLATFTIGSRDELPDRAVVNYAGVFENGTDLYYYDSPVASSESAEVVADANGDGGFQVQGACIYSDAGTYVIPVTIYAGNDLFGTVYATVSVSDAALAITAATGLQAVEQTPFQGITVATFTDANSYASPDDFLARITWQDGQTSTADVTQTGAGQFAISGDYTYEEAGSKTIQVQVFDNAGNQATTDATVDVEAPYTLTVNAAAQLALDDLSGMVQVASFSDTDPAAVSADFTATMSWGSSSLDCTVVPADGGGFDVYAAATTPFPGSNQPINVTVTDNDDGTSKTVSDNELLLDSGSTVLLAGLPTGSDVTIINGTTLNLEGAVVTLNTLTVDGGSIIDGSIAATSSASCSFSLDDATIGANLSGVSLTAGDLVSLSGTDYLSGTVTVNTAATSWTLPGR